MSLTARPPGRVLVVGSFSPEALEGSYVRAFRKLGLEVLQWDMPAAIARNTPFGRVGALVNNFLPVDAWIFKANRELIIHALQCRPDLVVVGGATRVTAGALAQIRTALPACQLVLVWPDPLLSLHRFCLESLPIFDLVASYSSANIGPLLRLGARRVEWVPLAFDPELHPPDLTPEPKGALARDCDISLIGNYSPEREAAVVQLLAADVRVKVWGNYRMGWKNAKDRSALKAYFQGRPLVGKEYSLIMRSTPLSLNPIVLTNYPAANMRFFEIPGCGGTALSAACPEFEEEFRDRESCFYFQHGKDLVQVAQNALENPELRTRVAANGQQIVLSRHTYTHRAELILSLLRCDACVPQQ